MTFPFNKTYTNDQIAPQNKQRKITYSVDKDRTERIITKTKH